MVVVESREAVVKSLSKGSFLGFIRALIMVWVRGWGVPLWLMAVGMISAIVPGLCERRALAPLYCAQDLFPHYPSQCDRGENESNGAV
jgi:hypothetical protein